MNSLIEKDHAEIKRLFKLLHDALRDHFDREQTLFQIRQKMIPDTHIDIREILSSHKSTHQELVKSLHSLLERFEAHILNEDNLHFHPLKDRIRIKSKL